MSFNCNYGALSGVNMEKIIELNTFLKIKNLASTGGQAKILIRSGEILVNGEVETRNRRKLHVGDKVSYHGKVYVVEEGMMR